MFGLYKAHIAFISGLLGYMRVTKAQVPDAAATHFIGGSTFGF